MRRTAKRRKAFPAPGAGAPALAAAASGVPAPAGTLVRELRSDLGVSRRIFARLTGYSERAIAGWEGGAALSEASRQRMLEMHRLQEALAHVVKPGRLPDWLDRPNEAFGGLKPLEVVERGEVDRLWRMLFELESGIPG